MTAANLYNESRHFSVSTFIFTGLGIAGGFPLTSGSINPGRGNSALRRLVPSP